MFKLTVFIFTTLVIIAEAWKSCEQVPFCKRLRNHAPLVTYSLVAVNTTHNAVHGKLLKSTGNDGSRLLEITSLQNGVFRIVIDDEVPSTPPRHTVPEALDGTPKLSTTSTCKKSDTSITLNNDRSRVVIYLNPFHIEVFIDNHKVATINSKQRLTIENNPPNVSVALDFSFPAAKAAYGLPLHADRLALRSTTKEEPYRFFNADNYGYKAHSTEALYGSVPVLYAHGTTHTAGIFWLNSAQTWVDVDVNPQEVNVHFMSETGTIDAFILPGPSISDTVKQYTKLTGTAPLPQYFTLGYHQSRFSYMSQTEVEDVIEQFNIHSLPLDCVWLDIDYTDGKKYFTWNLTSFPDPIGLQSHVQGKGKKLVAIIDPHIKVEAGYFLNDEAEKNGYYVRNPNGTNYVGECWPGPSSYLDLTNAKAADYYSSMYKTINTFQSKIIHIWNDMNEPAVFYTIPSEQEEFEKTIPLDCLHAQNYQHRDVHNMYGLLQVRATKKGMLSRPNNTVRPFVLTRSHFAGSQRYAGIWTGDVVSSWENLKIGIPMCLNEALAGISFCGADVGGFLGIPSDELYQRWYQTGAWLPFYRGHSDMSVPHREPYRFSKDVLERVTRSLEQRYAHLPVWYTLFYEHERTGEPVMRPIIYHYPHEHEALTIDTQFLIGSDILVAPVLSENANVSDVYLPGGEHQLWYNIDQAFTTYKGKGYQSFNINLDSVPVFYRGGGVIFRKDTHRLSTIETYNDPFSVYIAPDIRGFAHGKLYIDDYESYEYKTAEEYIYNEVKFSENKITLTNLNTPKFRTASKITKIVILNPPRRYQHASLHGINQLSVFYNHIDSTINIQCSLNLHEPFRIQLS